MIKKSSRIVATISIIFMILGMGFVTTYAYTLNSVDYRISIVFKVCAIVFSILGGLGVIPLAFLECGDDSKKKHRNKK